MKPIYFVCLICLLVACQGQQQQVRAQVEERPRITNFVYPAIPQVLTEPKERLSYLLRYYWTEFDFADSTLLTPDIAEQGFVNFIDLFNQSLVDEVECRASIDSLLKLAAPYPTALRYLLDHAEKYLYEPNSPAYNEEHYVWMAQAFVELPATPYADKSRLEFRIKLALRNCVGNPAEDFNFILADGRSTSLSAYTLQCPNLLLLFYDPECTSCEQTIKELISSQLLTAKIAAHELDVLAIYTEGNEDVWRRHLSGLPQTWHIGINKDMNVKDIPLYDLKAMPTLYLLDKDKKVIAKDMSVVSLIEYLRKN